MSALTAHRVSSALMMAVMTALIKPAWAISETSYADDYRRLVLPYYETGITSSFVGVAGAKISYRVFDRGPDTPAVIVLPGYSEPYRKYAEWIYDLGSRGYSIYIMDHRGQGASDRLTPLHDLGHVASFNDFVTDLETFMSTVVLARHHTRLHLLAHSMGGAIATLYLAKHPGVVASAVLSAPMFEINTGGTPEAVAYYFSMWKAFIGHGWDPIDGPDKYQFDPAATMEQMQLMSSAVRWAASREIIRDDPRLALGGVSYGWLYAALKATSAIETLGAAVETPIVIFKAGRDSTVRTEKYDRFCSFKPTTCTVASAPFADARHEILQERDAIRDEALALVLRQFAFAPRRGAP